MPYKGSRQRNAAVPSTHRQYKVLRKLNALRPVPDEVGTEEEDNDVQSEKEQSQEEVDKESLIIDTRRRKIISN